MTNKAVIDLGSLKAKLSVFDLQTDTLVLQKSYLTLLGKSITEHKKIIEEALNRLNDALVEIKKELTQFSNIDVVFIATESLRKAENKEDVYTIVQKHFPAHTVTILDQDLEGDMFFKVVSKYFKNIPLISMDIGGGSVQIFHGYYDSNSDLHVIHEKHLHKTGTYVLQQKYSPHNDVISDAFHNAVEEVRNEFSNLTLRSDVLVFGSTCMQDFLKESRIELRHDRPIPKHDFYVTKDDLCSLLDTIRKYPPDKRAHIYPSGEYFIYGADYLLINVLEAAQCTEAKYLYPTNLNSSYGFFM